MHVCTCLEAGAWQSSCRSQSRHLTSRCPAPCLRRSFCRGRGLRRAAANGSRCTAFFKLGGQTSNQAGVYGSQTRDDYNADDVEQYFNYMGMLATEGTYDRMDAMLGADIHPVDILLLWAAAENDTPKVAELLRAGADVSVKNPEGQTPLDLATAEEVQTLLRDPELAKDFVQ